jgi:UDP-N-acetylglucosamine acyltransferase
MAIHPSALIDKRAEIGKNNEIGPNVIIEGPVRIGDKNIIEAGVFIRGKAIIGNNNHFYSYAVIGQDPQDVLFKGGDTTTVIGNGNILREFVTIHRANSDENVTQIGDNNYFMVYSHVAHDVKMGNNNYLTNCAAVAGYVELGDAIFVSFAVGIHQFTRIGSYSIIGALTKIVQDVPPFMIVDGHPALVHGINVLGLKRNGFSPDRRVLLKKAYKQLYRSGASIKSSLVQLKNMIEDTENAEQSVDLQMLLDFIQNSKRGIILKAPKEGVLKATEI